MIHRQKPPRKNSRSTRTRTHAYHNEADGLMCPPGDFEDYEDWMTGQANDTGTPSDGSASLGF